jgi:hypothetical protein
MSNVIFIEFQSKRNFPEGSWLSEPDICSWDHKLPCLALRDMQLGIWKGFVAIDGYHPFYGQCIDDLLNVPAALEIFFCVHGGLSMSGRLPAKYKKYAKNLWWIGMETSHGGDLMPLLKLEGEDVNNPTSSQTYKDLRFIRRETNKLASLLSKIQ